LIKSVINIREILNIFFFYRTEDDSSDDVLGTTSSGIIDDRHTRHITHDNRLLSANILRRRIDHLSKNF
jgi:hypothetical protein